MSYSYYAPPAVDQTDIAVRRGFRLPYRTSELFSHRKNCSSAVEIPVWAVVKGREIGVEWAKRVRYVLDDQLNADTRPEIRSARATAWPGAVGYEDVMVDL